MSTSGSSVAQFGTAILNQGPAGGKREEKKAIGCCLEKGNSGFSLKCYLPVRQVQAGKSGSGFFGKKKEIELLSHCSRIFVLFLPMNSENGRLAGVWITRGVVANCWQRKKTPIPSGRQGDLPGISAWREQGGALQRLARGPLLARSARWAGIWKEGRLWQE